MIVEALKVQKSDIGGQQDGNSTKSCSLSLKNQENQDQSTVQMKSKSSAGEFPLASGRSAFYSIQDFIELNEPPPAPPPPNRPVMANILL